MKPPADGHGNCPHGMGREQPSGSRLPEAAGCLTSVFDAMDTGLYETVVGRQTDNPLQSAFPAKRVLHGDTRGAMLPRGEWNAALQAVWQRTGGGSKRSAYIHIPFCQRKCLYCGFFQNSCQEELETAYIDRLVTELQMQAGSSYLDDPVNAVFIGGGTPSALSPGNAGRLLKAIRDSLPLANDCELTLEGRVHDLVPAKMETWFQHGVNRISLGVQSFDSKVRQAAGRLDSRETVLERLETLSRYNQAAVIVDLIYGLPYQTPEIWQADLAFLKTAALDGWDLYQLNVYENSDLKREIEAGRLPPAANTQQQAAMFGAAHHLLDGWPVRQISVCHWARTGRERNLYNHMAQGGYTMLPFGAGAGGKIGGFSVLLERDVHRYISRIDSGEKPVMVMLAPHASAALHDAVKDQLKQGYLDVGSLTGIFDPRLAGLDALLAAWEKSGLLVRGRGVARLTVAGQFWYVNMTQSILECINAMLHGEWLWEKQQVAAQG